MLLVLFLFFCNTHQENGCEKSGSGWGGSAGCFGHLHPFEFIPDEADDWGEQMAKEYADSLAEVQEKKGIVGSALMDSLEEICYNVWIDSIREDYHQRTERWSEQYK